MKVSLEVFLRKMKFLSSLPKVYVLLGLLQLLISAILAKVVHHMFLVGMTTRII